MNYLAVVRCLIGGYVLTLHTTKEMASLVGALYQAQLERRKILLEDWIDINDGEAALRVDQIMMIYVEVYRRDGEDLVLENSTAPVQTLPAAY